MATLSNKHANAQRILYPGFTGGLNLSVSSEHLAKNELKEAKNVEYSTRTGSMRVRGGLVWSGKFDHRVLEVVPVSGRRGFLARLADTPNNNRTAAYFRWNNIWPVSGNLPPDKISSPLSVAVWEDASGKECWLIACGLLLYKFSDDPVPTLTRLTYSPTDCRLVFVRNGRVGVVSGKDDIIFSSVGDCESATAWTHDDNDESKMQRLGIGEEPARRT